MNKKVLEKVSKCKTVDEVLELAKTNGKNITKEQAKKAFDMTHSSGELYDEEVSNVSGGVGPACQRNAYEYVEFNSQEEVQFIFEIRQKVEYYADFFNVGSNDTHTAIVFRRRAAKNKDTLKWYDVYDIVYVDSAGYEQRRLCVDRTKFEK